MGTAHQLVRWKSVIENLARAFHTSDRQLGRIEQSNLNQHRCLVPVNVLVSQLAISESNDSDQRHLHAFSGRINSRQHPIHLDAVSELEYRSVLLVACADRFAIRSHL